MSLDGVINLYSSLTIYLPLVTGLVFIRKLNRSFRLLLLLIFIGTLIDNYLHFFDARDYKFWLLNIYTIIETILITAIYLNLIRNKAWKTSIKYSLFILCFFYIFNLFFIQGNDKLNSVSMTLECVFLIILSTNLFYQMMISVSSDSILKHEEFWFNTGVFFYFSLNFFTFLLSNELYGIQTVMFKGFRFWHIHNLANVLYNIAFAIALFLAGTRKTEGLAG